MTDVRIPSRSSSLARALLQACVITLLPTAAALAQPGPQVRVTAEETDIRTFQHRGDDLLTVAAAGSVFQVIHTHGDKYRHLPSNWYWVLLPRDEWGTTRPGWISGRDVELLPPPEPPKVASSTPQFFRSDRMAGTPTAPAASAATAPATAAVAPAAEPDVREMVVHFEFARSELTAEAKGRLAGAVAMLEAGEIVTIALEGHADAVGSDEFNEKLGMARAEAVKRHLAEQHQIPDDKISVVTLGESQPAASNDTPEGRAQNRRVVIRIGM